MASSVIIEGELSVVAVEPDFTELFYAVPAVFSSVGNHFRNCDFAIIVVGGQREVGDEFCLFRFLGFCKSLREIFCERSDCFKCVSFVVVCKLYSHKKSFFGS